VDILQLVDELEVIINKSFRIPFTSNIVINEDELFDILDQMRIAVPQEVKEARRTEAERERILARAQEEANKIESMAKEKLLSVVDDQEIVSEAHHRSQELVRQAEHEADQVKEEADQYVTDKLSSLEEHLLKLLTTVQNGLRQIQTTQPPPQIDARPAADNKVESREP
jgi:vacuolar-type H+-ATPase subunit H